MLSGSDQFDAADLMRLDGRLIVVTGASDGIGRAFAQAYAAAGADLILVGRRQEKLAETQALVKGLSGRSQILAVDLSSLQNIRILANTVEASIGDTDKKLVLVNNAGFGFTKPAVEVTEDDWNRVFDLQLKGTFFCCQALGRLMISRGYGKIINLSSTWSASTDKGKSIYGTAKAGISYMTAALSTEWAPLGVRVNAIAPTTTLTENTKQTLAADPERAKSLLSRIMLGRFAQPEDLTGAALFLASSASDFVTGQTLFVDGGWNALVSR